MKHDLIAIDELLKKINAKLDASLKGGARNV